MSASSWTAATRSHAGNRRRNNEDATLICDRNAIWAVADGMGGHEAGDVASRAIADALSAEMVWDAPASTGTAGAAALEPQPLTLAERVDWMESRLLQVDAQLQDSAREMGKGAVIGSTVVCLTVQGGTAVVLWAGDSRLYRLRNGRLEVVTRDHNPIVDQLERGLVSEEEALTTDTNIITRAVGGLRPLMLDVVVFDVRPSDTLLLCTDGLYRELETWELADSMALPDLEVAAETLLQKVLGRAARDNVSLVVMRHAEG
ncbi:MAG: PP2C family serine/threonine-protein phosphatase [Pseudomonadota bacterium]